VETVVIIWLKCILFSVIFQPKNLEIKTHKTVSVPAVVFEFKTYL